MEEFKPEYLPESIHAKMPNWVKEITDLVPSGIEKDMMLLGAFTVASSVLSNVHITYDRQTIYPNLFVFVIGGASSGKGRFTDTTALLDNILQAQRNAFDIQCKDYKAAKKRREKDLIEPKEKRLFIPMNSSSAALLEKLCRNGGMGCIMESETDVLNRSASTDWGISSENLRKAFHHEQLSLERVEKSIYIKHPRLTIGIAGTLNQYISLIGNAEDGLYSRGLYYYIPSKRVEPRNVFENSTPLAEQMTNSKGLFKKAFDLNAQFTREYRLSEDQKQIFQSAVESRIDSIQDAFINPPMDAVNRSLLQSLRIAMVLDGMGKICQSSNRIIHADTISIKLGLRITGHLLPHAFKFHSFLVKKRDSMDATPLKRMLLDQMPESFSRQEFVSKGLASYGVKTRSLDGYLKSLIDEKKIKRLVEGKYVKLNQEVTEFDDGENQFQSTGQTS